MSAVTKNRKLLNGPNQLNYISCFFWGQVYTLTILAGYRKTTVFMHKIIEKSYLKLFGQFEPKFAGIFLEWFTY